MVRVDEFQVNPPPTFDKMMHMEALEKVKGKSWFNKDISGSQSKSTPPKDSKSKEKGKDQKFGKWLRGLVEPTPKPTKVADGDPVSPLQTIDVPTKYYDLSSSVDELSLNKQPATSPEAVSPQDYLDELLKSRMYSIERFNSLDSAYHNEPSLLQQASYGMYMIEIVNAGNLEALEDCLCSGLSPSPCNEYGESLVHLVCRLGQRHLLEVMMDHGTDIQISDDWGRTPLHEACSCVNDKVSFETVHMLLMRDVRLLYIADSNNELPLMNVPEQHWQAFIEFFEERKDRYWPKRSADFAQTPPPLTQQKPNKRSVPDPRGALSADLAWMVASGAITSQEATEYMENRVQVEDIPNVNERLKNMVCGDLSDDEESGVYRADSDLDSV